MLGVTSDGDDRTDVTTTRDEPGVAGRSEGSPPPVGPSRAAVLRWVRRGASVLVFLAVVDYLVLPQVAGERAALRLLGTVRPWWAGIAVGFEVASLVSYSLLTRSMLPDRRPRFSWLIRGDLVGLGVSHILPGGAATSSAVRYRFLQQGGAPANDAAVGIAVQGAASTLMLAVMLWLSLVVSIPLLGLHRAYVAAAVIGAILIAAVVAALVLHSRAPAPTQEPLASVIRRLPRRFQPRVRHAVIGASEQLRQLLSDRRTLRSAALWAGGNWAFDAASLWVFLAAYGRYVNPVTLFVAYGIANLLGTLPISPGGLGIIEGVLIPSLVGFGTPRAVAVLAVVSWRLFEFWAPIPVAGVCYLSLRVQQWHQHRRSTSTGRLGCPSRRQVRPSTDLPPSPAGTADTRRADIETGRPVSVYRATRSGRETAGADGAHSSGGL